MNDANGEITTLVPTLPTAPLPVQPTCRITKSVSSRDNKTHTEPIGQATRRVASNDSTIELNTCS